MASAIIKKGSALLTFTVRNSRSYRDEATLSMNSTRVANPLVVRSLESTSAKPKTVLPVAGVFGANASGKSAFIKAMSDMRYVILNSFRHGHIDSGMPRRPFLLGSNPADTSTELRIELLLGGQHWEYGIEIDDNQVLHEYAYHSPRGRRVVLFERDQRQVDWGQALRTKGPAVSSLIRKNALLLSVFGAVGEPLTGRLFRWWHGNMLLASADDREIRTQMAARLLEGVHSRSRVQAMLAAADLGLVDVELVELDAESRDKLRRFVQEMSEREIVDEESAVFDEIRLVHGGESGRVPFEFDDESEGTKVWVSLIGPLLNTLDSGGVLLVDELYASLNPKLVMELIDLFQNPSTNPRCAQLIFNSHDPTLLEQREPRSLGRDQIWFAEKQENGTSSLFSVADFRGRRDEPIDRHYLAGRYGAVPNIDFAKFRRASLASEDAA